MQGQGIPPTGLSADHRALGKAVRRVRAVRGMSQECLAHEAGIHRNYVGSIERGEINPTFRTMLRVSGGLMVPLSSLVLLYERYQRLSADAER